MSFANAALNYKNEMPARTENGMKARATTASAVLDFFTKVGSYRGKDMSAQFTAALVEDQELTLRALLWTRDIREGAGERAQFRALLSKLEGYDAKLAAVLMPHIPTLGRWDDLFTYREHFNRLNAFKMIRTALLEDKNSLAAKWMPRKGPIAVELTKFLGLSPKQYRKLIVGLTSVVETQMCAKQWNEINFSHVPSVASARYQKAFGRNAKEAYATYLRELQKPVAERAAGVRINAGAVYPYDVIRSVTNGNAAVADQQWNALPNFIGDAKIFPIVDTSGSMGSMPFARYSYGRGFTGFTGAPQPIELSLGLGLYVSEKNTSNFKDLMMIFDTTPKLVTPKGSLTQRLQAIPEIAAGSTNLHAAFDMLLDIAVKGKVSAADMPEMLLILSDMQFNSCVRFDDSAREMIARKYANAGYEVPKIVFWNLSEYGDSNTPVRFDDNGVCMISGFSPSIMKSVLANDLEEFTPMSVMLKTLMKDRYAI
jgi:hypothetical protein